MTYLMGQMLFCLVLAALLGLVVGWFLRGIGCAKTAAQLLEAKKMLTQCEGHLQHGQSEDLARERSQALAELVADPGSEDISPPLIIKAAEGDERDELQRIYGIGAVLERRLNTLGITTFKQIMALSQTDIIALSDKIGAFPDRIERDGWLASAAREEAKKT